MSRPSKLQKIRRIKWCNLEEVHGTHYSTNVSRKLTNVTSRDKNKILANKTRQQRR